MRKVMVGLVVLFVVGLLSGVTQQGSSTEQKLFKPHEIPPPAENFVVQDEPKLTADYEKYLTEYMNDNFPFQYANEKCTWTCTVVVDSGGNPKLSCSISCPF